MKLKTKFQDEDFDLGEVVEANVYHGGSGRIKVIAEPTKGGMITFYFETLKGMNEMFEDAPEEPDSILNIYTDETDMGRITIEYNTEEGAKQAVEKFEAWKRLKNKGFRFKGWSGASGSNNQVVYCDFGKADVSLLDSLFGGEE